MSTHGTLVGPEVIQCRVESTLPWDGLAWGWMRTGGPKTNAPSMRGREGLPQACVHLQAPIWLAEDRNER